MNEGELNLIDMLLLDSLQHITSLKRGDYAWDIWLLSEMMRRIDTYE